MLLSPDLAFERDPRRQQELRCRPYADAIYRRTWGIDIGVERFECKHILDTTFAIDVQVRFPCGMILLGQEKFLSQKYANFETLTVEYMQNSEEQGDWFKLASQFYFTGYETSQGLSPWVVVNWPALVMATHKGTISWQANANKDGHAQASFRFIRMSNIPRDCIIAQEGTHARYD